MKIFDHIRFTLPAVTLQRVDLQSQAHVQESSPTNSSDIMHKNSWGKQLSEFSPQLYWWLLIFNQNLNCWRDCFRILQQSQLSNNKSLFTGDAYENKLKKCFERTLIALPDLWSASSMMKIAFTTIIVAITLTMGLEGGISKRPQSTRNLQNQHRKEHQRVSEIQWTVTLNEQFRCTPYKI